MCWTATRCSRSAVTRPRSVGASWIRSSRSGGRTGADGDVRRRFRWPLGLELGDLRSELVEKRPSTGSGLRRLAAGSGELHEHRGGSPAS